MYEASKAFKRRGGDYFKGSGIDIGAGPDCIDKFGINARNWDLKDGDAQYLASVASESVDFIHSSHCLEHMVDVRVALQNWIRVVRKGGYLVITIPDEELYEHNYWPSRFNSDHKWSFRLYSGNRLHGKSINVFDLLKNFWKDTEIIKVERIEAGFNWELGREVDQTGPANGPECAIEIILRKK